jgi:hypothetical protein
MPIGPSGFQALRNQGYVLGLLAVIYPVSCIVPGILKCSINICFKNKPLKLYGWILLFSSF